MRTAIADRVLRVVAAQLTGPAEPVAPAGGPADGWREFTAPLRAVPAARAVLLGFGTDVEVLTPPELVDDLVATARAVLEAYGRAGAVPGPAGALRPS